MPTYAKLYEAFINLEKQIEDALPVFQELLLALKSASALFPLVSSLTTS